ncbi:hypothetical protein BJX61DRAFT_540153 [Aspergillus egyptiacus]|nr:hypothetical protein BJX61DRAFT_540153 [Aspergillus egyptiacus]
MDTPSPIHTLLDDLTSGVEEPESPPAPPRDQELRLLPPRPVEPRLDNTAHLTGYFARNSPQGHPQPHRPLPVSIPPPPTARQTTVLPLPAPVSPTGPVPLALLLDPFDPTPGPQPPPTPRPRPIDFDEDRPISPLTLPSAVSSNHDLADFLDRFIHFFRVYHGVRAIVSKASHMIQDTPLGPFFRMGKDLYRFNGCLGPRCQSLLDRIYRAKLGKSLTQIYKQAVESLQSCLTVIEESNERHVGVNAVTTWPILMDIEFGELLAQRRPEALVILAHYACLLHRFRGFWLFGDAGAFIIREVADYLGPEWEEWMAWPKRVLSS